MDRFLPGKVALLLRPLTERLDTLLSASDTQASAKRSSLTAFAVRIVSALIALLSQVILARWMGEFEYGIFVLVWLSMVIIGDLACFGFHTTIIRYVPEYIRNNRFDEIRGIVATGRLLAITASTLIAVIGAAAIWIFREQFENYYIAPFVLGLIAMPMIALGNMLDGIARSRSWVVTALTPGYIVRPLLALLFMIGALAAHFPATAVTALLASIAATWLTTVGQFLIVQRAVDRKLPKGPQERHLRQWMAVSLPIFLVEGFFFLLINVDVLMVGHIMDPQHVGIYFATTKVLALAHFVYFAVKAGVAQRYSELLHGNDPHRFSQFVQDSVRWTFWPTLALGLILLALGKPLLMLFGSAFSEGYPLLFILMIGVIARASVGPAESVLNMSGHQNICALLYALTLGVNVILNIVLIPLWGLTGAAIATAAAMLVEATTLSLAVYFCLRIPMSVLIPRDRRLIPPGDS